MRKLTPEEVDIVLNNLIELMAKGDLEDWIERVKRGGE